jgi:hypothetical protein
LEVSVETVYSEAKRGVVMEDEIAKLLPKVDDYDLGWIRNNLNVKAIEINRWKSLVVELLDRVQAVEKSLHIAMLNRQQDVIKIGEISVERDELKKKIETLETRADKQETRQDKQGNFLNTLRKKGEAE